MVSRTWAVTAMAMVGWGLVPHHHHQVVRQAGGRGVGRGVLSEEVEVVAVEDRDVPEAHRGLHDALYGDGEAHGAGEVVVDRAREDGTQTYDILEWASRHRGIKVTGIYVARDAQGEARYVGYSRDVAKAVEAHRRTLGPEVASTVRVVEKDSLARRSDLEAMRAKVLAALPRTPEGNLPGAAGWAETTADSLEALDAAHADEYEAKKRKLQAAMAETVPDSGTDSATDDLRRAVESGDWSAVVDSDAAAPSAVVSPFADTARAQPKTTPGQSQPFTTKAVDAVLDDVRHLLQADGGDVRVVSVDAADKSVVLQLQGACGSCPSSTVTMKNGIERALRAAWPDLGAVSRLEERSERLDAASAEALLEPIRAAFTKLGGRATVLNAGLLGPGVVELEYSGPPNIRYGIELSLLGSPLVTEVRWLLEDHPTD